MNPNPEYLSLSVGKAAMRAMTLGLFESFRERGVHIATVTVAALVDAGSAEASAVADKFWEIHSEKEGAWSWDVRFQIKCD